MVKLTDDYQEKSAAFTDAKIELPQFDQEAMKIQTKEKPIWVHFGGGNLFRAFHARIAQDLLNKGGLTSGIIVAETYDEEVIQHVYQPYDNRILQVVMKQNGQQDKTLLASVADSLYYNQANLSGWQRLKQIFTAPSLQMVTMSITEKGYQLTDIDGQLTQAATTDIQQGPQHARTNMAAIARLLLARYQADALPIAMISTDNFSENGQRFQDGIITIAKGWVKNGFAPSGFLDYLINPQKVSFPWTMIDRITPNPAPAVADNLKHIGFSDTTIVHTDKHTNIAPFSNTEEVHYLVIEDQFPNGRPPLEQAGVILTNRKTVNDADQMKVTACLNPLHTGLAIFGSLLGYQSIAAEMENPALVALVKRLGYQEALPVVKDPKIINPQQFIDEVINKRLPNTSIPDTPQRIASDTSQKMAIRYGVTLKHYLDQNADLTKLQAIPLIIAGWCRYLMAIDDQGRPFTPSPDPLLTQLQPHVASIKLGMDVDVSAHLRPILTNKNIFSVDLYQVGLETKIETFFEQMIKGPKAVAQTIQQALEVN